MHGVYCDALDSDDELPRSRDVTDIPDTSFFHKTCYCTPSFTHSGFASLSPARSVSFVFKSSLCDVAYQPLPTWQAHPVRSVAIILEDKLLKTVKVQFCSKVHFCAELFECPKYRTNKIFWWQHYHTDTKLLLWYWLVLKSGLHLCASAGWGQAHLLYGMSHDYVITSLVATAGFA